MALTVFAEKMGFFHRGCGGESFAPFDVCLSPPPGPTPIPYVNHLFASDLIKGSKTVFIDGEPTFLEDYYIFLLATDIANTVGITEANPDNIILDAHYNPRARNTEWLPEARETDMSEYTGDWKDSYYHRGYEEQHYLRLHGD